MIQDSLAHSSSYLALHPLFPAAFEYLENFDPNTPDGKYEIDGERLYASVQRYETAPEDAKAWETHQVYADIQFIASGREKIFYAPVEAFQPTTPYNLEKDVQKYDGAGVQDATAAVLTPRSFAVFFPQDGHKPGCRAGESAEPVVKVVLKVRVKG